MTTATGNNPALSSRVFKVELTSAEDVERFYNEFPKTNDAKTRPRTNNFRSRFQPKGRMFGPKKQLTTTNDNTTPQDDKPAPPKQQQQQQVIVTVHIASKLFGPPQWTLAWKERQALFRRLGNLLHNTDPSDTKQMQALHIDGTIMGQVIPAEHVALLNRRRNGSSNKNTATNASSLSADSPTCIFPSPSLAIPTSSPARLSSSSTLKSLRIDSGLIFNNLSSVYALAGALESHVQLEEVRLCQFLNQVLPLQMDHDMDDAMKFPMQYSASTSLLDPLMESFQKMPHLKSLELSCLASFVSWDQSLISIQMLNRFLTKHNKKKKKQQKQQQQQQQNYSTKFPSATRNDCSSKNQYPMLETLNLTNLGLEDVHFYSIAEHVISMMNPRISTSFQLSSLSSLKELVLSANKNTQIGLQTLLQHIHYLTASISYTSSSSFSSSSDISSSSSSSSSSPFSASSLYRLEIMNDISLTPTLFQDVVYPWLSHPFCRLQHFQMTTTIAVSKYRSQMNKFLQLHRNFATDREQFAFYDPMSTTLDCLKVVDHVVDDLDCLYLLLRERPCLCAIDNDDDGQNLSLAHEMMIDNEYRNLSI